MRDFETWFSTFRVSISSYDYYVDFHKVVNCVEQVKVHLCILNSLIGSKNIKQEFMNIIKKYPEVIKTIPLLLAIRSNEIYAQDGDGSFLYKFDKINQNIEQYAIFMHKTGLFDMISNHIINNLVDYAFGVETGLDSNGRKNRGGHLMENLVESYIIKSGFIYKDNFFKEIYINDIEKRWDVNFSFLSNKKKSTKRFDFVIKSQAGIYAIETNFYASSGSKLNETARSYKMLAIELKNIKNFSFIWITDGQGWKNAKSNLKETFNEMENIYNINDLENGIISKIIK